MKIFKFSLGLFTVCLSLSVFAGEKGGNGGGGHFCPNGRNEVYDLQEGRVRYHIPVLTLEGTKEETIELGLKHVREQFPVLAKLLRNEVAKVQQKMEVVNLTIERTLDADNLYVEENCQYFQVANWDTTVDRLFVSRTRFNAFPPAQQGVLIMHEAAYSLYRSHQIGLQQEVGDQAVDPARKFIAEVYSSDKISTILVKKPFLSGGLLQVPAKDKGSARYAPRSPITDVVLVENPECISKQYRVTFENNGKYNLMPYFGAEAGKLVKVKASKILTYDVPGLPLKFAFQDYTDIERISAGSELNNSYSPLTSAGVVVTIERVGCEKESFLGMCAIANSLGVFKMAQCADSTISSFDFSQM